MKRILLSLLLIGVLLTMSGCSTSMVSKIIFDEDMELYETTPAQTTTTRVNLDDINNYEKVIQTKYPEGVDAFYIDEEKCVKSELSSFRIVDYHASDGVVLYYYCGKSPQDPGMTYQCFAKYNVENNKYSVVSESMEETVQVPEFYYAAGEDRYIFTFSSRIYRYNYNADSWDNDNVEWFDRPKMKDKLLSYYSTDELVYTDAICTDVVPIDEEFDNFVFVYLLDSDDFSADGNDGLLHFVICEINFTDHTGFVIADAKKENNVLLASVPKNKTAVFDIDDNSFQFYRIGQTKEEVREYPATGVTKLVSLDGYIIAFTESTVRVFEPNEGVLTLVLSITGGMEYSPHTNAQILIINEECVFAAATDELMRFDAGEKSTCSEGCFYAVFDGGNGTVAGIGIEGDIEQTTTLFDERGRVKSKNTFKRKATWQDIAYAKLYEFALE